MIVMTKTLEDCRVELMKQMDTYIIDIIGDDEITEMWQVIGLPDGWDDDILMEIAIDDELWLDVVDAFAKCWKRSEKRG